MSDIFVTVVEMPVFEENCYIIGRSNQKDCVIIDPGFDPDLVLDDLEAKELKPVAILCTHGHLDHIAGIPKIKEAFLDCPVYVGEKDASKFTDARENMSAHFGFPLTVPAADVLLNVSTDKPEVLDLAGVKIKVMFVPGHSQGHVVYLIEDHDPMFLFSGDVLFAGNIGRTDFPDGNGPLLLKGIKETIMTLPNPTIVYTGHGDSTTIGKERQTNPYCY